MPVVLLLKLLAIFAVAGAGYAAGRRRWLGPGETARVLSHATFVLFMPALLFRTTARIDLATLPWTTLGAFFIPLGGLLLAVYLSQRRQVAGGELPVAAPAVRAITASFGNTVQLGIPIAAALYGEDGLAVHLAIVSVHALAILTVTTALVESDLARAGPGGHPLGRRLALTVRNTVVHPVVGPVVAGLIWNLAALPLPVPLDEALRLLGQAAVPVALVLIGLSFAEQGSAALRAAAGAAVLLGALKLLVLPALVLAAGLAVGLRGAPLAVIVMCAALPTGSNALIFAQRYQALIAETSVATALSTLAFALTAPLWLLLLTAVG